MPVSIHRPLTVLVAFLLAAPTFAEPIRRNVEHDESPAITPAAAGQRSGSHKLTAWGAALILIGAAVATASVVVTQKASAECEARTPGARCGWYRFGSRAPWIGAGTAATGGVLMLIGRGRQSPSIVIQRNRIRATLSLEF